MRILSVFWVRTPYSLVLGYWKLRMTMLVLSLQTLWRQHVSPQTWHPHMRVHGAVTWKTMKFVMFLRFCVHSRRERNAVRYTRRVFY